MRVITVVGSGRAACVRCKNQVPRGEPCVQITTYDRNNKLCRNCVQEIRDELFGNSDAQGDVGRYKVNAKS